jgi:hypothetical protein
MCWISVVNMTNKVGFLMFGESNLPPQVGAFYSLKKLYLPDQADPQGESGAQLCSQIERP